MRTFNRALAWIVITAGGAAILHGAELQPAAYSAWQAYVRGADTRMQARLNTGAGFLWSDEAAGSEQRLQNGEILVGAGIGNGTRVVPHGLIHHWIAAAFIPHSTLASVLRIAHDYADYKQFYQPSIVDSKLLAGTGTEPSFRMRTLHRVLFVTAVIDSDFVTHDFQVDARRWYIVADAMRVQEVENFGRPGERVLPPDTGRGFVWRVHSVSRYEERNGGVYVEIETMALSRNIPVALRWLVDPAVARFSQSEMIDSLRQTREAVMNSTSPQKLKDYSLAADLGTARAVDGRQ